MRKAKRWIWIVGVLFGVIGGIAYGSYNQRGKKECCPATRCIGKRYENGPIWDEWWQNDWFSVLEEAERLPINDDAYIGVVHIVNGMPEYWIGMFFPSDTKVPNGFEYIDIVPMEYAVGYLYSLTIFL